MATFLIIDKDDNLREDVCSFLRSTGNKVQQAKDFPSAVKLIDKGHFDVIVSDVKIPGGNIRDLVRYVRDKDPNTVVVVNSEIDTVQEGVRAVKEGAFGIIQKPFSLPELNFQIKKALERQEGVPEGEGPADRFRNVYQPANFIGECPQIKDLFNIVMRVAGTSSSVIITGETGTGKELVAGAIHYNSKRASGPFVRVNCAALPEQLLESELFGYERGAFTGAEKLRIGRFEQANKGTIFLDEVADMSLYTQAKVLRVLQEKEFERLGSNESVKTDVRIISATNRDLLEQMEKGLFREDLYYRLNVVTIHLPPLRERGDDVKLLSQFFLKKYSAELNHRIKGVDPEAVQMLAGYHWPGNIRELENTIERAVLLADGEKITRDDLKLIFAHRPFARNARKVEGNGQLILPEEGVDLDELEKNFVVQALERSDFVQKEAAKLLNVSSRVLNYKIKQFGITHPKWSQNR
jgi:DNA-binding NtrC family response regulator